MATFKEYPGVKVYTDGAGHRREMDATYLPKMQEWTYVYSTAPCADECPVCNSDEQDDYAGERWDEDY